MLAPDRLLTPRARVRTFLVWQFPTLILGAIYASALPASRPDLIRDPFVASALIALVVASLAGFAFPWERYPFAFRILVPVADVVAVAFLTLKVASEIPSTGLLVALPVVWLAFDFGRSGLTVAVVASVVVSCARVASADGIPNSGLDWAQVLLEPLTYITLAVVSRLVSSILASNRRLLLRSSHRTQQALREAEDNALLLQGILGTIDAAVAFYDSSGTFRMSNDRADSLAARGKISLKVAPHHGSAVWHQHKRSSVPGPHQVIPRALNGESIHGEVQWIGELSDPVAVQWRARRLQRDDGRQLGTVIAWWDVSDLVEAVEVQDEFLATVSHELRTPLTSIVGYLELAEDEVERLNSTTRQCSRDCEEDSHALPSNDETAPLVGSLKVIGRNARVLLDRISLLLLATESRIVQPSLVAIDIRNLLDAALVKHVPIAEAAQVSLVFDSHENSASAICLVDPGRFEQAMDNLISNAIKYSPHGGEVRVSTQVSDQTVDVHVSDTGVGMSAGEQRQAFDRFYRTEGARRSATQGIGLGLAIVREIIHAHGGRIGVRSAIGQGTRITVSLPRGSQQGR